MAGEVLLWPILASQETKVELELQPCWTTEPAVEKPQYLAGYENVQICQLPGSGQAKLRNKKHGQKFLEKPLNLRVVLLLLSL